MQKGVADTIISFITHNNNKLDHIQENGDKIRLEVPVTTLSGLLF